MISPKDLDEAVASIIAARTSRRPLGRLPPSGATLSLDDAYSIQEAYVRECRLPVVGYKIGCASKESQALVGAAGASAGALGHPLDGLVWIANELSGGGYGLGAGDMIATGTWTGLHFVPEPAEVVADFGSLSRVEVSVRA